MNRQTEQREDGEMSGMVVRFNTHEPKETYREAMRRIEMQEAQAALRRKYTRTLNNGARRHFDTE